jgi:hypothetical protein
MTNSVSLSRYGKESGSSISFADNKVSTHIQPNQLVDLLLVVLNLPVAATFWAESWYFHGEKAYVG